jgi:hypothetical protein
MEQRLAGHEHRAAGNAHGGLVTAHDVGVRERKAPARLACPDLASRSPRCPARGWCCAAGRR